MNNSPKTFEDRRDFLEACAGGVLSLLLPKTAAADKKRPPVDPAEAICRETAAASQNYCAPDLKYERGQFEADFNSLVEKDMWQSFDPMKYGDLDSAIKAFMKAVDQALERKYPKVCTSRTDDPSRFECSVVSKNGKKGLVGDIRFHIYGDDNGLYVYPIAHAKNCCSEDDTSCGNVVRPISQKPRPKRFPPEKK